MEFSPIGNLEMPAFQPFLISKTGTRVKTQTMEAKILYCAPLLYIRRPHSPQQGLK